MLLTYTYVYIMLLFSWQDRVGAAAAPGNLMVLVRILSL